MISTDKLDDIFRDCLFNDGENHDKFVEANGVQMRCGLHPERLESHKQEIIDMLMQLPDDFMKSKGGGGTFLNACMDKDGNQWGEHRNMDQLFTLGNAIKKVEYPMPREMWGALPGGMPYITVNDTN